MSRFLIPMIALFISKIVMLIMLAVLLLYLLLFGKSLFTSR